MESEIRDVALDQVRVLPMIQESSAHPAGEPNGNGAVPSGEPVGAFRSAPFAKAMGVYLSATILFRLINFGRILLLTWWMTRQQFGLFNMVLLVVNVLTPLGSFGLNEAITRYVPQYEHRGELRRFLRESFMVLMAVSLISVAILFALAHFLGVFFFAQVFTDPVIQAEFRADAPAIARFSAMVIGLLIVYFYLLAVLKGLRMFTALSQLELAHSLMFLGGAYLAIVTDHLSALTMTGVYGISLALPITWVGIGLMRSLAGWNAQGSASGGDDIGRKLFRFSVWTTLAGVTWQVLVYYPAWFLNKIHGHEAVAVFSAVRQIGQFILVGAVAVVTVVMTTVTKTWESRGRAAAERQLSLAFRGTCLGLLVLCSLITLSRHLIIRMFSEPYAPGADILPLQLLFFLCGSFLAFLPIHFHLIEKTRHLVWPWAIGVSANVLYAIWLASPKLEDIQQSAVWSALAPVTSRVFTVGFSDPAGLGSAAWCGVFAIFTALATCIVLMRVEDVYLDRGSYVVVLSSFLLAARDEILAVGVVCLLVLALWTNLVFSADERRRILGYIRGSIAHVPTFGYLGRRINGNRHQ